MHYTTFAGKVGRGVVNGMKSRYKATDSGHAYPPLHFMAVAMAMHLAGPDIFNLFGNFWIDKLIKLQQADGSIELPHTEGKQLQKEDKFIASTAAFAIILLLQNPGAMERSLPKAKRPGTAGGLYGDTATKSDARPFLGVRANTFAGSLEVLKVVEKSPSETGGVTVGDLIIEFKGKKIEKTQDLRSELDKCSAGQHVSVTVLRGGERKKLDVKLGALEKPKAAADDEETPSSKKNDTEEGELF
jgi:hypothetical protein